MGGCGGATLSWQLTFKGEEDGGGRADDEDDDVEGVCDDIVTAKPRRKGELDADDNGEAKTDRLDDDKTAKELLLIVTDLEIVVALEGLSLP